MTVVHRRQSFRASKAMATRVLNHPNIEILWNTNVLEFLSASALAKEKRARDADMAEDEAAAGEAQQQQQQQQDEEKVEEKKGDSSEEETGTGAEARAEEAGGTKKGVARAKQKKQKKQKGKQKQTEDTLKALRLLVTDGGAADEGGGGSSGGYEERVMEVDGVFVAIGHLPNTKLFRGDTGLRKDEEGYIYVSHESPRRNSALILLTHFTD